jgi:hypothetical protein
MGLGTGTSAWAVEVEVPERPCPSVDASSTIKALLTCVRRPKMKTAFAAALLLAALLLKRTSLSSYG